MMFKDLRAGECFTFARGPRGTMRKVGPAAFSDGLHEAHIGARRKVATALCTPSELGRPLRPLVELGGAGGGAALLRDSSRHGGRPLIELGGVRRRPPPLR